jgi:glycosyltransferase involved in cell wall biosynthesis
MSNHSPLVSVILPCRNEEPYIADCVQSILRQEAVPAGLEVIVADGMSDDGTREIVHELATRDRRLRIVDNPARIVSAGLNAAIRLAKGEIIIRMDAHTTYASDYIRSCVEVLRSTAAQNVGGPWVARGTGFIGTAIAAAFQSPFAVGSTRGHNPDYEGMVDTVYLGCWPRHVFDRIGLFDEDLVRNQDDEFNLRLNAKGGQIWQSPRIRSWYAPRSSLRALFSQYKQYGYWKVRVIQKHGRPASLRHLIPAGLVLTAAALTVTALWLPLAAKGWVGCFTVYVGAVLIASIHTSLTYGWKVFPLLPPVFACYHFGYGYGFLRGLVEFVILRREPQRAYTSLTRAPANRPDRHV